MVQAPRVFIGNASEASLVADAVTEELARALENHAVEQPDVTSWDLVEPAATVIDTLRDEGDRRPARLCPRQRPRRDPRRNSRHRLSLRQPARLVRLGRGQRHLRHWRTKLVSTLEAAHERIYQHSLQLEDARAYAAYGQHSSVGKSSRSTRNCPGASTSSCSGSRSGSEDRPDSGRSLPKSPSDRTSVVGARDVRHLGLSNVTAEQLRSAHVAQPITAVQVEYSLWTRDIEEELLPTARELGVGVVACGPLGNGFLARSIDSLDDGDYRHNSPRFRGENLKVNQNRFAPLRGMAETMGVTAAQLALAWLLHQGDAIVPIPGTRTPHISPSTSPPRTSSSTKRRYAGSTRSRPAASRRGPRCSTDIARPAHLARTSRASRLDTSHCPSFGGPAPSVLGSIGSSRVDSGQGRWSELGADVSAVVVDEFEGGSVGHGSAGEVVWEAEVDPAQRFEPVELVG
jgi:Aldo/keto reductase family